MANGGPELSQNANQQRASIGSGAGDGMFESAFYNAFAVSPQEGHHNAPVDGPIPNRFSGFSPFSPDPNYISNMLSDREPNSAKESILRGTPTYPQRFGGNGRASAENTPSGNLSSTHIGLGAPNRSTTPSHNDSFGFNFSHSTSAFQISRSPARNGAENPPSRPSSSQTASTHTTREHEGFHNGNGSLASLYLAANNSAETMRSPGEMTDSSGSVQFKLSMNNSPASPPA